MSTNTPMTRGYSMTSAWRFIDQAYDAETRQKIVDQLSPEVRKAMGTYKDVEFYPATHWSEILRGVATVVGKTDADAERELQSCGAFTASEATNTFLRLLMRVLTPALFAKKIPSLWSRDNTAGQFSVDLSDINRGRLVFQLSDVDGYAYCGPAAMGWISFAMKTMGRQTNTMKQMGWSLENPAPKNVVIDLELAKD